MAWERCTACNGEGRILEKYNQYAGTYSNEMITCGICRGRGGWEVAGRSTSSSNTSTDNNKNLTIVVLLIGGILYLLSGKKEPPKAPVAAPLAKNLDAIVQNIGVETPSDLAKANGIWEYTHSDNLVSTYLIKNGQLFIFDKDANNKAHWKSNGTIVIIDEFSYPKKVDINGPNNENMKAIYDIKGNDIYIQFPVDLLKPEAALRPRPTAFDKAQIWNLRRKEVAPF